MLRQKTNRSKQAFVAKFLCETKTVQHLILLGFSFSCIQTKGCCFLKQNSAAKCQWWKWSIQTPTNTFLYFKTNGWGSISDRGEKINSFKKVEIDLEQWMLSPSHWVCVLDPWSCSWDLDQDQGGPLSGWVGLRPYPSQGEDPALGDLFLAGGCRVPKAPDFLTGANFFLHPPPASKVVPWDPTSL